MTCIRKRHGPGSLALRCGVVFLCSEGRSLAFCGDPVFRLAGFGGEDLGSLWLGIVFRLVAKAIGVGIVVPRALVTRDAIDDLVADIGMFEADTDELGQVARADPDREATAVDWVRAVIPNADAQKANPMLIGIKTGERLAERFRHAVAAVRSHLYLMLDRLRTRIEADRMVRGGHDNALDACFPCRLKGVVKADNVALEDFLPCALARDAPKMNDAVAPLHHAFDRFHVGNIGLID